MLNYINKIFNINVFWKTKDNNQGHQIVKEILEIGVDGEIELEWCLVGRKFNAVADILAKNSYDIIGTDVIYYYVPDIIAKLLVVDKAGSAGPSLM